MDPLQYVSEASRAASSRLDLSGNCLSADTCGLVAKRLARGHSFTELCLADCLIGDEGLSKLFPFLQADTVLESVNLKGNNLRGKGAELVGRLICQNASIKRLSLEWNGLGLWENGVKRLSEGLALNASLEFLDLRSNHFSHSSIAGIATGLSTNHTIKEIDLRWNGAGVSGGRALLAALQANSTLQHLHTEGNSIPPEITDAITSALLMRSRQLSLESRQLVESEQLSRRLRHLQQDSEKQIHGLLEKMDSERSTYLDSTRMAQSEIMELKADLQENTCTITELTERLAVAEGALEHKRAECAELLEKESETRARLGGAVQQHAKEVLALQQTIGELRSAVQERAASSALREKDWEHKVEAVELEMQHAELRCAALAQELARARSDGEARATALQEQLSSQNEASRLKLQQMEALHLDQGKQKEELQRCSEASLLQRVSEAEARTAQLHTELNSATEKEAEEKMSLIAASDKVQVSLKRKDSECALLQEQLLRLRELHSADKVCVSELEQRLRQQLAEKGRLEEELLAKKQCCRETSQEYDCYRQKMSAASQQWEQEREGLRGDSDRLQSTLAEQRRALDRQKQINNDLHEEHDSARRQSEQETSRLRATVERQHAAIAHMRQEEVHRTAVLKTALQSCLAPSTTLAEGL